MCKCLHCVLFLSSPGLLSISALQELMKGQEGELALGREIENLGEM